MLFDGNKTPTKLGKIVIKLESDAAIDGSLQASTLKASFDGEIRADVSVNGMDLTIDITIHGKAEEQRTPISK